MANLEREALRKDCVAQWRDSGHSGNDHTAMRPAIGRRIPSLPGAF